MRFFLVKRIFLKGRMSVQAELFTKDLEQFHTEEKHYLDASGNFLGYNAKRGIKVLKPEEHVKMKFDNKTLFKGSGFTLEDPTCSMSDPTLKGEGAYIGLSNLNFGRITQPHEIQGTTLKDLDINDLKTKMPPLFTLHDELSSRYVQNTFQGKAFQEKIYEEGELTAPIMKSIEEQEDADTVTESSWFCKGCSKCFATKASLKRHHDRKKSCKEICEKKEDLSGTPIEVPDKPYIVDWVEQMQNKAISGDQNEKPYCRFCEIEFANKSNLNKHLAKSVACDKLAKQEFLKLLTT